MNARGLLPFNAWSRERIAQGRKVCTSRHKKYTEDPRVAFISDELVPWRFIRERLYNLEGADSPEELQGVIEKIMRRPVQDDEGFYVHFGSFTEAI